MSEIESKRELVPNRIRIRAVPKVAESCRKLPARLDSTNRKLPKLPKLQFASLRFTREQANFPGQGHTIRSPYEY